MNANKKKLTGVLVAILLVILILVIALWVVPFAQMASYRGSETVQAHAAQLVADYEAETGETVSQEDVCRDMAYLSRPCTKQGTLPTPSPAPGKGVWSTPCRLLTRRPSILMSTVPAAAPFITSSKATMASARAA